MLLSFLFQVFKYLTKRLPPSSTVSKALCDDDEATLRRGRAARSYCRRRDREAAERLRLAAQCRRAAQAWDWAREVLRRQEEEAAAATSRPPDSRYAACPGLFLEEDVCSGSAATEGFGSPWGGVPSASYLSRPQGIDGSALAMGFGPISSAGQGAWW
jgi:hypothetical protein